MVENTVRLPAPRTNGQVSLEKMLLSRRSVRRFSVDCLTLAEISQLLWAAQGVTDARGLRTAPSAGGLYPLEICLVAGFVDGLQAGIYRYRMMQNELSVITIGDLRDPLCRSALGQKAVATAAVTVSVCATAGRRRV